MIFTDALLEHPDVSTGVKLVLALNAAYPTRNRPTNEKISRSLSCFDNTSLAAARREVASSKHAYLDRSGCKQGRPIRFQRVAAFADPSRTNRLTFVPTAPVAALKGRGARAAILLFAFYCREQLMRGAIQLTDEEAAWRLGWDRKTVERLRRRLERVGAIEKVKGAAGRGGAAVYIVPGAWKGGEANLDPASGFREERTRRLSRIEAGGATEMIVYASPGESELLDLRIEWADAKTLADLRARIAREQAARPTQPYLHARELLGEGGVLHSVIQPPKAIAPGYSEGVTPGYSEGIPPGYSERNCSTESSLSTEPYAAAPREEKEDQEQAVCEKVDGLAAAVSLPAAAVEALTTIFGPKAATGKMGKAVGDTLRLIAKRHGDDLNPTQLSLASDALVAALSEAERHATTTRELYPAALTRLSYLVGDDRLHAALKAKRGDLGDAPIGDDLIDISASLDELLNTA